MKEFRVPPEIIRKIVKNELIEAGFSNAGFLCTLLPRNYVADATQKRREHVAYDMLFSINMQCRIAVIRGIC